MEYSGRWLSFLRHRCRFRRTSNWAISQPTSSAVHNWRQINYFTWRSNMRRRRTASRRQTLPTKLMQRIVTSIRRDRVLVVMHWWFWTTLTNTSSRLSRSSQLLLIIPIAAIITSYKWNWKQVQRLKVIKVSIINSILEILLLIYSSQLRLLILTFTKERMPQINWLLTIDLLEIIQLKLVILGAIESLRNIWAINLTKISMQTISKVVAESITNKNRREKTPTNWT